MRSNIAYTTIDDRKFLLDAPEGINVSALAFAFATRTRR